MSPQAKKVTIRMYNVGFGDSFLVTFPAADRPRKILFDCGSIKQGKAGAIQDVVEKIVEDVKEDDGVARIDVVVATHRHRDHVSGFESPLWQDVEVQEVWLPWTEHPTDPEAKRIRDAQNALALALRQAFVGASAELQEMAFNAAANEAAMDTLHNGFAGNPRRRFLPVKDRSEHTFTPPCLPNVVIHAMGPSRNEDVISDMDPPQGESYLKLALSAKAEKEDPRSPFPGDWTLDEGDVSSLYPLLTDEERTAIQEAGQGMPEDVAAALDSAVNGTSLMLMLRFGKAYLLFPGDAQWGTWRAALDDPEWRVLLSKTTFLKVGHHGSHNATPKEYVEDVLPKPEVEKLECAMVSTIKRGSWPIPKKKLMEELGLRTDELVRSDQITDAEGPFFKKKGELYVEAKLPA